MVIVQKQSLKIDQVINDSTIVLSWNKYAGANFKHYTLTRQATYLKGDKFGNYYDTVFTSSDANETSVTENKMPLAIDISYFLIVQTDAFTSGPNRAEVIYTRPNSLLYCIPTDVLFSKSLNKLYIIEQKKISILDHSNGRPVLTKEFPAGIGYCDMATYNGSNELYVPGNDGWLNIVDATNLTVKDRIYVAGYTIGSVLARNGKLYVSTSDESLGSFSNNMKIYDRATKTLLSRAGSYYPSRLMAFDNTNVEMIEMPVNRYPADVSYHLFTPDGVRVNSNGPSSVNAYVGTSIVRSFPYGDRFISSNFGTIVTKSLVFERYLKKDGFYADFAFNNNGSVIYAADAQLKRIDVINYPAYTNTGSYPTKLYPYKLFRDDNMLISVSKSVQDNISNAYILVEKIKL